MISDIIFQGDETASRLRSRHCFLLFSDNAAFAEVQVTCPLATALKRNNEREERVPDQIIKNMAEKLEQPKNDVFWEKFSMEFDNSQDIPR